MTATVDLNGACAFITGGAGFIGSHIADKVLEAGASRVVILDDFSRGRKENLDSARMTGRIEVHDGDIRDQALVDQLTAGTDIVFHQAALRITQAAEEPRRAIEVMVIGTQNILEAAVRHGVKKVLAASSASVYGEAMYLPMDEAHPFNNRTLYGAAKIANEQMHRAYAEMHGLRYLMLRPFNVYGPRMDAFGAYTEVMIRWLDRLSRGIAPVIFGDGTQTMDFVYVEDIARAYLLAATADHTDDVLNAGSGTGTSLLELSRLLCSATGHPEIEPVFEPPRSVNPVSRRQASTEAATARIGFTASTGLREGIDRLVSWYSAISTRSTIPA
ncbi:MAG TPA: NAD-dependent epimerase/dehydratase family protein [Tepidiformaceae bacterium]|nr:NAD-dependent epimerase/dehydratase family protein [Tepidiformaceae bacterium]